jgi:hypothetical protein
MIGPTEFLLVTFLVIASIGLVGTALFWIVKLVKWLGSL